MAQSNGDELEQIKNSLKLTLQNYAFSDPKQYFDKTGTGFELEADHFITLIQAYFHKQERADRKQHELEARIDELVDMHRNIMDNPKWHSNAPDQAFAYGRVHRIIDERIDQLKGEGSHDSIEQ